MSAMPEIVTGSRGRVLKGLACVPGCACKKHSAPKGRVKPKVASVPCLNCGTVRMVSPCYGPGMAAEKKFCDRACFTEHQQARMAERRSSGDTRKYDMKPEEFQARLAAQNEQCAICQKEIGIGAHRDHCHETGEWRGLLCSNCNLGIGLLQDSAEVAFNAWQYLVSGGVSFEPSNSLH